MNITNNKDKTYWQYSGDEMEGLCQKFTKKN